MASQSVYRDQRHDASSSRLILSPSRSGPSMSNSPSGGDMSSDGHLEVSDPQSGSEADGESSAPPPTRRATAYLTLSDDDSEVEVIQEDSGSKAPSPRHAGARKSWSKSARLSAKSARSTDKGKQRLDVDIDLVEGHIKEESWDNEESGNSMWTDDDNEDEIQFKDEKGNWNTWKPYSRAKANRQKNQLVFQMTDIEDEKLEWRKEMLDVMKKKEEEWRLDIADRWLEIWKLDELSFNEPAPGTVFAPDFDPESAITPPVLPPEVEYTDDCFLSTPSYTHVQQTFVSLPIHEQHLATARPKLDDWEEDLEGEGMMKLVRSYLGGDATGESDEKWRELGGDEEKEEEYTRNFLGDLLHDDCFAVIDPARVFRDFAALQHIFRRLGGTYEDFEKLRKDDGEEVSKLKAEDIQLRKLQDATSVFFQVTGNTAWDVVNDHAKMSEELVAPKFTHNEEIKICEFCGACDCTFHHDHAAYNISTTTSYAALKRVNVGGQSDKSMPCGDSCFRHGLSDTKWTREQDTELRSILKGQEKVITSCFLRAYSVLKKSCAEIQAYRIAKSIGIPPRSPLRPKIPRRKDWKQLRAKPPKPKGKMTKKQQMKFDNALKPLGTNGYQPCQHEGACTSKTRCLCVVNRNYCDHYCGCNGDCLRRWRGCSCEEFCNEYCICCDEGRECDPELCGCPHVADDFSGQGCGNQRIRRLQQKETRIKDSDIPNAGFGLCLMEDAKANDLLGVYGGEHLYSESDFGRWASLFLDRMYAFELDPDTVCLVNSFEHGSHTRFINDPHLTESDSAQQEANAVAREFNCEPRFVYVSGTHQIIIVATKPMKAGTELYLDYGEVYRHGGFK